MIYTTNKYTLNIEVSYVTSKTSDDNDETFIVITLLHNLDTYICRKNIKDIKGFNVIARSVDNFVNYINKIMTTNELFVSFDNKVFTLSFVISNGIVDDTYSFDCIYDTIINKNNKKRHLLNTIFTLCNDVSNIDVTLNSIKLLLLNNNPINIDTFVKSLGNDLILLKSYDYNIICNLKDKNEENILHWAAYYSNIDVVTYLVEHGAAVNLKNNYDDTALMIATQKCNIEIITYLVEHGADINLKNNIGYTALIVAAQKGNIKIVTYLVEHGADINLKNNSGSTALMFAAEKGNIKIVTYLVEHGADINLKNNSGSTALMFAAEKGNIEVIKYLLGLGADVNVTNNVLLSNIEIIKYLVEQSAYVNVNTINNKMLLQHAVDTNNITLLKALINQM